MTYVFDMYYAAFKGSADWAELQNTVEDSPWHREANVAVHTEMTIEQYRNRFAPFRSDVQNTIAMFALLYHDRGKPAAEETLEKKDGSGLYRRYAGHEQNSAVAFTEAYIKDVNLRNALSPSHARTVRWIIEHHLPYGYKDVTKRRALLTAINGTMTSIEDTFYDVLRSDAAGRISDDHEQKLANVEDWIAAFRAQEPFVITPTRDQKMFILVGPSGSGKSTWVAGNLKEHDEIISMDTYRLEFTTFKGFPRTAEETDAQFYERAWPFATIEHEKEFKVFFGKRIDEQLRAAAVSGGNVFIDIVNASKKKRQMFIELGRRYGFKIVGVEFWNSFDTLVARQGTRPDKAVPASSIKQQMYATTCMWLGYECEDVVLAIGDK